MERFAGRGRQRGLGAATQVALMTLLLAKLGKAMLSLQPTLLIINGSLTVESLFNTIQWYKFSHSLP